MILTSTTLSIEVALAGSATSDELPYTTSFVDVTTTAFTPGSSNGTTSGTTNVLIIPAPGADTHRQIKFMSVINKDVASATVIFKLKDNTTRREFYKATLAPGQQIHYTDTTGFVFKDELGRTIVVSSEAPSTDSVVLNPITSTRNVVQPTGDFVPLNLRGHAAQTVNLLNIQNSGGTTLASFDASGNISANNITATPSANAVVKAQASGKIAAGWVTEILSLNDLSNVNASSPTTTDLLSYSGSAWTSRDQSEVTDGGTF